MLTAIIPTFNREEYFTQAVNALQAQTRRPDEIIVWDDGSTDGTEGAARKFGSAIRYFRGENAGKSRALNAAMAEARGDLIWICDDDDLALPDAAETLTAALARAPEAGMAAGSYRRFRDRPDGTRDERGPGYWPDLSEGTPIRHLLEDIFLFQNASLVRREIYARAGPFREDLARSIDYDMVLRIGTLAPIVAMDKPLFLQRKHDGDRGPAKARHAAARSDDVWKETDRALFRFYRDRLPLAFYAALFDAREPRVVERAALLQRACVYARRTDWPAALEDFAAAAVVAPDAALAPVENAICRRAMAGKHGIAEALGPEIRRAFGRIGREGGAGRAIARSLARGILWRGQTALSENRLGDARRIGQFVAAIYRVGSGPPGPGPEIAERRILPGSAFLSSWETAVTRT